MNTDICFVINTEQGHLEGLSKFLVYSIRTLGGIFLEVPIVSYQLREGCEVSCETVSYLAKYNVRHISRPVNIDYIHYPFANKIYACMESFKDYNFDTLVFLDSDMLFLREPVDYFNFNRPGMMLRPVDMEYITVRADFDGLERNYWSWIYSHFSISRRVEVHTTVYGSPVLEYYQGGMIVAHRIKDFFPAWYEMFDQIMKNEVSPISGDNFVEQSALACCIAKKDVDVKLLDNRYNIPVHLLLQRMWWLRNTFDLDNAVLIHYHGAFDDRGLSPLLARKLLRTSRGKLLLKEATLLGIYQPFGLKDFNQYCRRLVSRFSNSFQRVVYFDRSS